MEQSLVKLLREAHFNNTEERELAVIPLDNESVAYEVSRVFPLESPLWWAYNRASVELNRELPFSMPAILSDVGGFDIITYGNEFDHESAVIWRFSGDNVREAVRQYMQDKVPTILTARETFMTGEDVAYQLIGTAVLHVKPNPVEPHLRVKLG